MTQTATMQRMTRARSSLVLDHPWFGVLSLRLRIIEEPGLGTMATNGTDLIYDPAFVEPLNDSELTGVIAHEVMHCALRHMYRTGARDMRVWNEACDLAINPLLLSTGFVLPAGGLNDPRFHGMAAEAIYAQLEREKKPGGNKAGDKPSPTGEFGEPAKDPSDKGDGNSPAPDAPMTETDWEIATEQATAIATKRGHVGADIQQTVALNRESATNWRDVLREFVQQITPSDYSWHRPNRRHIGGGMYLPGVVKEGCPRLVVAIDTSGSITQDLLNIFASEMNAILQQCQPERIDVIYCDASVKGQQSFSPGEELTASMLQPKGGGGTKFQPLFDHVNADDEPPAAVVYLTDLDGPTPIEPDYPVLWVVPEWISNKPAPFGQRVMLTKY